MEFVTILGLVAATISTIGFFPQAIKTIKTKRTADLSLGMYLFLTVGFTLWLIYGIMLKDLPIIFANVAVVPVNLIILYYIIRNKRS